MSVETYGNFIAGTWSVPEAGERFADHNPADTSDVLGHFLNHLRLDKSRGF